VAHLQQERMGYNWDYVMVVKVRAADEKVTSFQKQNSLKRIVQKISQVSALLSFLVDEHALDFSHGAVNPSYLILRVEWRPPCSFLPHEHTYSLRSVVL